MYEQLRVQSFVTDGQDENNMSSPEEHRRNYSLTLRLMDD